MIIYSRILNFLKMAFKRLKSFFCRMIMCIFMLSTGSNTYKLNVPKLLLPFYSSVATNFTLEVRQGCFLWYVHRRMLPVSLKYLLSLIQHPKRTL